MMHNKMTLKMWRQWLAGGDAEVEKRAEVPSILNEDVLKFERKVLWLMTTAMILLLRMYPSQMTAIRITVNSYSPSPGVLNHWLDVRQAKGVQSASCAVKFGTSRCRIGCCTLFFASFFMHFLPLDFIKSTLIPAKNTTLSAALTWDEFLWFL